MKAMIQRGTSVKAAEAVDAAFRSYSEQFRAITRRAQARFERRDWSGTQSDALERLSLYRTVLNPLLDEVSDRLGSEVTDKSVWAEMRTLYSTLIAGRDDFDIAETFFNSVTRRIFDTVGVDPAIEFVDSDFVTPPTHSRLPVYRTYQRPADNSVLIAEILSDFALTVGYEDLERDAKLVAGRVEQRLLELGALSIVELAEIVESLFFRGKGAYIVGRLFSGSHDVPLVIALHNEEERGVVVDAVLTRPEDLRVLFSFTRSYFHVDTGRPYDLVRFLRSLMPGKRPAELYIATGYNKHGKTELYRDLLHHLERSAGKFVAARGKKGLVMIVFTMPGHDLVFKVIRDRFPPQKRTTRKRVMDSYRLVFNHDRAGRLIDAQEFEHLAFARDRFSADLLDELTAEASETIRIAGDTVIVSHVYVERRVIPLDIYIREANEEAVRRAVIDYGQCIKDLAAANIFAGDLLLKNFGVTRHGRVVFYDYDELTDLLVCNFRRIPQPIHPEDELSDEPWYSIGPDDVFPEEFRRFLGLRSPMKEAFEEQHSDIFDTSLWQGLQESIKAGEIVEVTPYSESDRVTIER
jgi:isocitrate dehydrogenase kinase/phosphatase